MNSKNKHYLYTLLLIISVCAASPFLFDGYAAEPSENIDTAAITNDAEPSDSSIPSVTLAVDLPETYSYSDIEETTVENKELVFTESDSSYFDDALFIGDSRTVGLYEYGNLQNADYFCDTGMSVYNVLSEKVTVSGIGKVSLDNLLSCNNYGKIYFMLGINELGYNFDTTIKKYNEIVEYIKEKQPAAVIFIEANLHVTKSRSDKDDIYNNNNIDRFNESISELADNQTIFYLNVNELFDDENGSLNEDFTSDNAHVLGKYYEVWCNWLCTKTILQ